MQQPLKTTALTLEELIPVLNLRHFYPGKMLEASRKGDVVTGLYVECAPILRDDKKAALEKAIEPHPFKVHWEGNGKDRLVIREVNKKK